MTQTTLGLPVTVRPPFNRCICARRLRWNEHRASDGEIDWLVEWFTDRCKCGVRMTWRPKAGVT